MADTDIKEPPALRFESPDRDNLEKAEHTFVNPVDEDEEFSYAEQRKIIHRIDRRLVVILGLMYCVSLIDRGNMPNAAVAGMHDDLNTDIGYRYSIATLVFFITYTVFQPPATVITHKVGPKIFLPTLCVAWGLVMVRMHLNLR